MTRTVNAHPTRRGVPRHRRRGPRLLSLALLGTTVALAIAGPAAGATFTTRAKWKNCDTRTAGIHVTGTFPGVSAIHGEGRYMVKKEIRWDRLIGSGRWRVSDTRRTQTAWTQVGNPSFNFVTSIGDTTNWGATYLRGWRAHVTLKLIKNRPGPRDQKVDEIDIYPTKGSFREMGSYCDAQGVPAPGFGSGGGS